MARVRVPTILRPSVDGAAEVIAPGATVGEVLGTVAEIHSEFADVVFERDGSLNHGSLLRELSFVEARAAARLQHPNVVTVHRIGQIDDRPYIVSESR